MTQAGTRAGFHELRVAHVDRLCDDAAAITFAVPEPLAAAYDFEAGQHVTLRRVVDGVEHRRSYSVCAPVGGELRIGVREIPDGLFSSWLVRGVCPGDVVEVQPPTGRFRVEAGAGGWHLLVGAGSGITPLLSIAATLLADPRARVSLLYGNRSAESVMFAEELADLKDRHPARFHVVHVLSREPQAVDLLSGRIDADRLRQLLSALVPLAAVDQVWLCGPLGLVDSARAVLASLGVRREQVHAELFHADEPPPEPRRPRPAGAGADAADGSDEADAAELTVLLDGRSTTSRLAAETTVLDGAATVRGDLPFACRGGVCGTCRARVVAGTVEMRRNYALDEAEVERGFVLTCQARATSPRVTVDFDA